jgi:hypothetical protein
VRWRSSVRFRASAFDFVAQLFAELFDAVDLIEHVGGEQRGCGSGDHFGVGITDFAEKVIDNGRGSLFRFAGAWRAWKT